jgi:hypothetical protein
MGISCLVYVWFTPISETQLGHKSLGVINHNMLSSYLKTNQMLFFNMMEHHSTFSVKWQYSWTDSCYFLASVISRSEPPWLCLWCFVTDEDYVPPISITLNNLTDWLRTMITKIETFTASCLECRCISSRCVQDNKLVRYLACLEYGGGGGLVIVARFLFV